MGKNRKQSNPEQPAYGATFGSNLSFGASEAYKLLRTNLNFSLPDVEGCKTIGITSTLRGEGKSTTAINLAYTVAQTGQKVLLIEGDLRLPNIAKRLSLQKTPGLSNLLAGQCNGNDVLQRSPLADTMWVISAGDIPPNPAELLNSEQMRETLKFLAKHFDMIIVDLPPVSVVSDALIISRLLDGMVVVVRQNLCDRRELNDTIRQLKFTECKILGFVMTDSQIHEKRYKRSYGRKNRYGYGYDYGYGHKRQAKYANPEQAKEDNQ